jgi:hypothetical protein
LVVIKTTAYSEEDFCLITDLSDEQISEVIEPIVESERENEDEYDNEGLFGALLMVYPNNYIQMVIDADTIII